MNQGLFARVAAAVVPLTLAMPAMAFAPGGQYETFNKNDATITDRQTRLQWQRHSYLATSWDDANAHCSTLALGGLGPGQWRLPSVKELMTLVDEAVEIEYVTGLGLQYYAFDRRAFSDLPGGSFYAWPKRADGNAWHVDFRTGEARTDNALNSGYVLCVHTE